MRFFLVLALFVVVVRAAPARADDIRLQWPLRPGLPVVCRAFDPPDPDWRPGHPGVDLAGTPGQPVYAAGAGTVVFAGFTGAWLATTSNGDSACRPLGFVA